VKRNRAAIEGGRAATEIIRAAHKPDVPVPRMHRTGRIASKYAPEYAKGTIAASVDWSQSKLRPKYAPEYAKV